MSLSFDDRLLGEKVDNYCSSIEDEEEEQVVDTSPVEAPPTAPYSGRSTNTGPKGVIEDWQRYKKLEVERREEEDKERLELCKKFSTTCRTYKEDVEAKEKEEAFLTKLEELEDEFIEEYRRKRMEEMRRVYSDIPRFGDVISLTKDNFVSAIDDESSKTLILIHIYENNVLGCEAVNGCFNCLAAEYPTVKFCKIRASDAKMSQNFSREGVPAIVVYKNKQLIGNLINVTNQLGEDFFSSDLESFLLEHGFLPDKTIDPSASSIRASELRNDSDSDFELD